MQRSKQGVVDIIHPLPLTSTSIRQMDPNYHRYV